MRKTIFQRISSGLLALLMLSTLAVSPALAADSKSEPAAVHTQAAAGEKTREEMIANTSAVLLQNGKTRTKPFKQNANSVDVQVKLDDSVESCYMTVYAYIGTAGFDPDNSTSSFVLWKGQVKTGTITCPFNADVALKVGYKIIACVNTPAGKDAEGSTNYAYVKSQALEVVDENARVSSLTCIRTLPLTKRLWNREPPRCTSP